MSPRVRAGLQIGLLLAVVIGLVLLFPRAYAFVEMAAQKLGQPRPTIEIAAPNVELTWNTDADWVKRAKYYGSEMLDKKQIRQLPDYDKFINTSFVNELAKTK